MCVSCPSKCGASSFSQMYLMEYGYLPMSEAENVEEIRSVTDVERAVRQLQRMGGLRETGSIDFATRELMASPRCGVRDLDSDRDPGAPQSYQIGGSKWHKNDITYRSV